jgi:hypothetical protein
VSGITSEIISKEDFFSLLWQKCAADWYVEVRGTKNKDFTGRIYSKWTPIGYLSDFFSEIDKLTSSVPHSIHYVVCPRLAPSGKKHIKGESNLAAIPAFWVDVDGAFNWEDRYLQGTKALQLNKLGIVPNLYVVSGWGVHLFWLLDTPVTDGTLGERCNKILAALFNGDTQASNWAHTLRAPGSYNCKVVPNRPVVAKLISDQRYCTQIFIERLEKFSKLLSQKDTKRTQIDKEKKREKEKINHKKITLTDKKNQLIQLLQQSNCIIMREALDRPTNLNYVKWFSIGAGLYKVFGSEAEETFYEISSMDTARYSREAAERKWTDIVQSDYMPYNCIKMGIDCPHMPPTGTCKNIAMFFRRISKHL